MTDKITVIHHSADFDGIFCREIARKFLPTAELIGWDYGDPLIDFPKDGTVYVLDLSPDLFNRETNLIANDRLIWIDHHKSAIEKHTAQIPGYRIDGVAACRLAWQWFSALCHIIDSGYHNPNEIARTGGLKLPPKVLFADRQVEEPWAVRLAGEYDVWDKRDPDAELFQHGLRSRDLDGWWLAMLADEAKAPIAEIESRLENGEKLDLLPNGSIRVVGLGDRVVRNLLKRGEAIQYAKAKENESIIRHNGFTVIWEEFTWLACNAARYNSLLFAAGLKPEHDGCLGFNWDGKRWRVSLYHAPGKEHHDFSVIAVKHGGGGHRGAFGFMCGSLPFGPFVG